MAPKSFTEEMYALLLSLLRRQRHRRRGTMTLDTHDLAQESYLRLSAQRHSAVPGSAEFRAAAWVTVQRVLLDYLRARARRKHRPEGGHIPLHELDENELALAMGHADAGLGRCLAELERTDPEALRIIEYRFYLGYSVEAAAQHLGVSPATLARRWRTIRAWLLSRVEAT